LARANGSRRSLLYNCGMKLLLSIACAGLLAVIAAPPVAKAKFSETRRCESRTVSDGDGSVTQSASGGKWSLNAEVPLEGVTAGPDTAFAVKLGNLEWVGSLKDDAKFKEGASSAQLDLKLPKYPDWPASAVAKLKWGRDKLTLNLAGKTDRSPSPVADGYADDKEGDLGGVIKLTIRFGDKSTDIGIPFTGTLKRKTVQTEVVSGQAVDIQMKGETK